MTDQTQDDANTAERTGMPENRQAYHVPKLEDYGKVSELTQTSEKGSFYDFGGYPNCYTSLT